MALGTRKVTRIVRETCDPMECTLGILEISWFAEFQIASGAISNLQIRAHLREGTPATLSQLVEGSPRVFCDRIYPRAVFSRPEWSLGFAEERAWRKRPVGSWGR